MLIRIIKKILSIIPFLGIALALFMIIPGSWFTRRKVVIIGFSSLLFYNPDQHCIILIPKLKLCIFFATTK